MYSFNDEHERRQLNYERYRKLTKYGHSISTERTSRESLYVVSTDPFGRSYYQKPVGEIIKTDRMTGQEYAVEGWAVKEFLTDNKVQLINKVSADLLTGEAPSVQIGEEGKNDEINKWFGAEIIERNHFHTFLIENALRASSLGDVWIEPRIEDDRIGLYSIEPDYIDPVLEEGKLTSVQYGWELEDVKTGNARIDKLLESKKRLNRLVRIKEHFEGRIEHSCWVVRNDKKTETVSFKMVDEELYNKADNQQNKQFAFKQDEKGTILNTIIEYTGIDEILLIHWPNYKLLSWFGQSDNAMVEALQNALNSRQTQLNSVFDKHADPAMYGPPGYLDTYGRLYMSVGGGSYFPIEADEKAPGYLVWEAHAREVHDEIKRLYKAICDNAEVSMALTGMDEGGIESGRALMYKLIRSLAAKARKALYMVEMIKKLFRIIQKMKIVWIDGNGADVGEIYKNDWTDEEILPVEITLKDSLPTDEQMYVETILSMYREKTISRETAITMLAKYFEEIDPKTEIEKVEGEGERQMVSEYKMLGVRNAGLPFEKPEGEE